MGRRSSHKPEELRELIITTTTELLKSEGLTGLTAREIARRVGYSPGTLYNVFVDLDDLILVIESRLLDELASRLKDVPASLEPEERICQLASAYLAFTQDNPKLWNLLFEHRMPPGWEIPPAYKTKLEIPLTILENSMIPIIGNSDPARLHRAARVIWASIHGITSLATTDKLASITNDSAGVLIDELVRTYLAGLKHGRDEHH
jgi:AcrR family transcriptional regulator